MPDYQPHTIRRTAEYSAPTFKENSAPFDSTQRTTPVISPCRALVGASFGGGWSGMPSLNTSQVIKFMAQPSGASPHGRETLIGQCRAFIPVHADLGRLILACDRDASTHELRCRSPADRLHPATK